MTKSETRKLQKIEADLWDSLCEAERRAGFLGVKEVDCELCNLRRARWASVSKVLKALNVKQDYNL